MRAPRPAAARPAVRRAAVRRAAVRAAAVRAAAVRAAAVLAALGAAGPVAAQATGPRTTAPAKVAPARPAPARGASAAAPAAADLAAAARARADSARLPWTAADARFMRAMIGHHSQAVQMSRLAPERAGSEAVRTLAARIINAQQDEIAIMQRWLRDRGQPVPAAPAAGDDPHAGHDMAGHGMSGHDMAGHDMAGHDTSTRGMAGHDMAGHDMAGHDMAGHGAASDSAAHAAMPGMLTPAQLAELAAARGREFDRLFLTYMIRHHRGATAMVRDLFATPGAGQDEQVFKFASDVNVDQTTEIARMQRMLAAVLFAGE